MRFMMRSTYVLLGILILGSALTACNTFRGIGEDISVAGQGLSKGAVNAKQKINESEYNNTTQYTYPDATTSASQPTEQDYQTTPTQQNY